MTVSENRNAGIFAAASSGRYALAAFFALFTIILGIEPAFAGATVNDVAENMVTSSAQLPALVSALAYLLGILFGVLGIFKLKDHVENPAQTPLRIGIIRLLIGGALFALPILYEAVFVAINGTGPATMSFDNDTISQSVSGLMGSLAGIIPWPNINSILENIRDSVQEIPALLSAAAYLIGLILGISGLLKLREHVENPDQTPLKEPVIRFLTAGALFALPTIYNAMYDIGGGNTGIGLAGAARDFLGTLGFFVSPYGDGGFLDCNPVSALLGSTLGNSVCGVFIHTAAIPAFLTACAYVIGLVFGFWGIFKIKAHVQNPQQTGLWEGVSRFIAGGFFFALPVIIEVARATLVPLSVDAAGVAALLLINYNDTGVGACGGALGPVAAAPGPMGLDGVITCFMRDLTGPIHVLLNFFAFCAGIIFLMIGVSRLIRSAQDGARGPGGIGTIMTFATGAALISYNQLVHAFTASLFTNPINKTFAFTNPINKTFAVMQYTTGMLAPEVDAAHAVISAIIKFVLIVGLISFVRGIFIIRSVAEGNSQASIMSGVTHMVAGALAVNLGPLLNAVQATLGIGGFGITFS